MQTFPTSIPTAEHTVATAVVPAERGAAGTVIDVRRVTKSFGHTVAVDDLSFALDAGEIVGLLGENGAGKSTIIGVLAGLFGQDYAGELAVRGDAYRPASVADAERAGIVLIPQEINVVPELTVAQHLFLNNEPTRWGLVDHLEMRRGAVAVLAEFELDVDASRPMGTLDLARQQLVMIVKALHKQARLLILDEPTAALDGDEAERLFARLRSFRRRGTTSLFVSHRLAEVFALADRILVLRDGRLVGDHRGADASRTVVVHQMLGATVSERTLPPRALVSGPSAHARRTPDRALGDRRESSARRGRHLRRRGRRSRWPVRARRLRRRGRRQGDLRRLVGTRHGNDPDRRSRGDDPVARGRDRLRDRVHRTGSA